MVFTCNVLSTLLVDLPLQVILWSVSCAPKAQQLSPQNLTFETSLVSSGDGLLYESCIQSHTVSVFN